MPTENTPLSTNGLLMPLDFPVAQYEFIYKKAEPYAKSMHDIYSQFGGAWNGLAYRFLAATEYEAAFTSSLVKMGSSPEPIERHQQERNLFGFFSNGFSVFDSVFYGLFSLGSLISAKFFPMNTPKDQQKISPPTTAAVMEKAFPKDPINDVLKRIMQDPSYLEWREIRNILTHRAAPGRTFFVSMSSDEVLPDEWKIKDIPLDEKMAITRRLELARLLSDMLIGIEQFVKSRL